MSFEELKLQYSKGVEVELGRTNEKILKIGGDNPLRIAVPFGVSGKADLKLDLKKRVNVLVDAGADLIQELSTYGNYSDLRSELIKECKVPYGTVLTYEFYDRCIKEKVLTEEKARNILIDTFKSQISDGIDYTTIHASLSIEMLENTLKHRRKRAIPMTSRSGSMLRTLMNKHNIDNPLNLFFNDLAKIAAKENVLISLGSTFRPAAIYDTNDKTQILEIRAQRLFVKTALSFGTKLMLEGLSHGVPTDVNAYVKFARNECENIPITALGPLPIDIAAGYDHIAASIGITLGAISGLDLINIVTAKEHLAMPSEQEMIDAIRAAKVAIYTAIVMMNDGKHNLRDRSMSVARNKLDWKCQSELTLFPKLFDQIIREEKLHDGEGCTICGRRCPLKIEKLR